MSIEFVYQQLLALMQNVRLRLAIAAWVLVALGASFGAFQGLEYRLADTAAMLEWKPSRDDVIVVTIDAPSFQDISAPWPWPRDLHAELIKQLRSGGARAIVYDIVFDQSRPEDAEFAEAIASAGNVYLAAERAVVQTSKGQLETTTLPTDILSSAAAGIGVAGIDLDRDGRLRRMPSAGDSLVYSVTRGLDGREIKETRNAPAYIRFGGTDSAPTTVSYYQALDAERMLPADIFRDRIVLIGLGLEASPDIRKQTADRISVPFFAARQGSMPGVMAQAEILSSALAGDGLNDAPAWALIALWAMAITSSLVVVHSAATSAGRASGVWGLSLLGLFVIIVSARMQGAVLTGAAPATGLMLVGAGAMGQSSWVAFRQRRRLAEGFGRYVSTEIMQKLLAEPAMLNLGGAVRPVSIVVTDLEGFTNLMETMPANEGAAILREYLGSLGDVVLQHGGMIDQFIGDSLVALFNAPALQDDHASRALACAQDLTQAGLAFRDRMRARGVAFGTTRVGGDTGKAMVGNFGTAKRFHYTAMGEVTNIASRLEVANKTLGTHLLVSARLFRAAGAPAGFILAGRLLLPGIQEAVEAVTLSDGLSRQEEGTCLQLWSRMPADANLAREIDELIAGSHPSASYQRALQWLSAAAWGETVRTTK